MRTTIDLDRDATKAIEALRRATGVGLSEAVNELIRRGLMAHEPPEPFAPIHRDLGLKVDVSNIADAIDFLEGPDAR